MQQFNMWHVGAALCVLFALAQPHTAAAPFSLINKNVERVVDLTSQLAKITVTMTVENTGSVAEQTVHVFLDPEAPGKLAYFGAKDTRKEDLSAKRSVLDNKNVYLVRLAQPLKAGASTAITVEMVYSHALEAYPNEIAQKDRQLVRYHSRHHFFTPYKTVWQTTAFTLPTRNIESYTKVKPSAVNDMTVSYGPYEGVPPTLETSDNKIVLHFESNAPFVTVTNLARRIDVSHWGSVSVVEDVSLLHAGAKLRGPFSRYDYQRGDTAGGGQSHSVKSYRTILPAGAHSIYYRDSNGNISTSTMRSRRDWVELELQPRYPLFGGWRASYTLGYTLPSLNYLTTRAASRYSLRVPLVDHVLDDAVVDELETTIVLPVWATDAEVHLPFEGIARLKNRAVNKYFDFHGRQAIVLTMSNCVEQHMHPVEIVYTWAPLTMFYEPLLLAAAVFVLFLVAIVYVRLDFSIYRRPTIPCATDAHAKSH